MVKLIKYLHKKQYLQVFKNIIWEVLQIKIHYLMDLLMFTKHIYMVRFNLLFFRCGFLICQEKKSVIQFLFFLFCFFHIISKKRKKTSDDFYCLFIHMMYMIFFCFFLCSLHSVWWTNSAPPVPNLLASTLISYHSYSFIYTFLSLSLCFSCITHMLVCVC